MTNIMKFLLDHLDIMNFWLILNSPIGLSSLSKMTPWRYLLSDSMSVFAYSYFELKVEVRKIKAVDRKGESMDEKSKWRPKQFKFLKAEGGKLWLISAICFCAVFLSLSVVLSFSYRRNNRKNTLIRTYGSTSNEIKAME